MNWTAFFGFIGALLGLLTVIFLFAKLGFWVADRFAEPQSRAYEVIYLLVAFGPLVLAGAALAGLKS